MNTKFVSPRGVDDVVGNAVGVVDAFDECRCGDGVVGVFFEDECCWCCLVNGWWWSRGG